MISDVAKAGWNTVAFCGAVVFCWMKDPYGMALMGIWLISMNLLDIRDKIESKGVNWKQ